MYLVVGLGNPGRRYECTRHNVGFMLVECLARRLGSTFTSFRRKALIGRCQISDQAIILAKPQTYMNLSGIAVRDLLSYFKIPLERCLMVYDERALPLGKLRIRGSGSAGGHNGMQSVIDYLGTSDLPRLRIGIGNDSSIVDMTAFVLSRFPTEEKNRLEEVFENCLAAVETFITQGIDAAMAQYN